MKNIKYKLMGFAYAIVSLILAYILVTHKSSYPIIMIGVIFVIVLGALLGKVVPESAKKSANRFYQKPTLYLVLYFLITLFVAWFDLPFWVNLIAYAVVLIPVGKIIISYKD
ncbi:hypothetical protein ACFO26_08230 [Lactococcus nasutitermitis]|uniref:Integral membrane protein n=1 Tax=Lactococcus nasutitermitis TaxID=1652957 RepID=A0ABV9JHD7_9LACT|nr:hypothetical protein [Lactococcus nasutitermitis]